MWLHEQLSSPTRTMRCANKLGAGEDASDAHGGRAEGHTISSGVRQDHNVLIATVS